MKTTDQIRISLGNLAQALNMAVLLPASVGVHIGRGFHGFALRNMSDPGQLGNDDFTEAYFTTTSGNTYRIQMCEDVSNNYGKWTMVSLRDNLGLGRTKQLVSHVFSEEEMRNAILKVGEHFFYGKGGETTTITAILAVNASRCYLANPTDSKLVSDIRTEFLLRMM